MTQLVHLAHGLVENGGNDAAVAMAGRSGIALAQPEAADKAVALLVISEAQAHAVGIVLAAAEAVILLQLNVAGVVSSLVFFAAIERFYRERAPGLCIMSGGLSLA